MSRILKIEVISDGKRLVLCGGSGDSIRHILAQAGFSIGVCGGGSCGKCRVRLVSGRVSEPTDSDGCVLSCRAKILSDIIISECPNTPLRRISSNDEKNAVCGTLGIAVDVGTTTLALSAYDLKTKTPIGMLTAKNPQTEFGADLISRISASEKHLENLTGSVRAALGNMANSLCARGSIKRASVAANTVMSELLLGNDPRYLGDSRAALKHKNATHLIGADVCYAMTGISADEVIILPHISPFVGGDITAGIFGLFPAPPAKPSLLCDLGTNGEVALLDGERIICSSAAAGPAFEGGGIECGMEYNTGAISHLSWDSNMLSIETVGKKSPVGICGSGICDALAFMLTHGIIKRDGSFAERAELPDAFASRVRSGRFYLTGNVYISQQDVRAFQLARAAIKCAIGAVCKAANEKPSAIYVSGGFGSGVFEKSLKDLSIIPTDADTKAMGNSALAGAERLLLSPELIHAAEAIAKRAISIPLALSDSFGEDFIKQIDFE